VGVIKLESTLKQIRRPLCSASSVVCPLTAYFAFSYG
jgi:hypothetical protein